MTTDRPEDVEARIAEDRARIDSTVTALQERLSPGQLLDQALGYIKSGGGETAANLGRSVKENPFPLILTGVGLAWLMQSTARGNGAGGPSIGRDAHARASAAAHELQRRSDETQEAFEARRAEAKAKALDMQRRANESAAEFRARVEQRMTSLRHTAQESGQQAAHQANRLGRQARSYMEREPLVAAAALAGIGALISGMMPSTRTENEAFGEQAAATRSRAASAAGDAAERAERVAADTAAAASEQAEQSARREASGGGPH